MQLTPLSDTWLPDLKDATQDLHNQCHAHPLAQRMYRGDVTASVWADWLAAFYVLHEQADRELPNGMKRKFALMDDLSRLPGFTASPAATAFAEELSASETALGAAYVLHGAHANGGEIIADRIRGRLPCKFVTYEDPEQARGWVDQLRERSDLADQARATFQTMLAVMDEVHVRE